MRKFPIELLWLAILIVPLSCGGGGGGGGGSSQQVTVAIKPPSATVPLGNTQSFTATVTGSNAKVTWSVQEGSAGGAVSTAGSYQAPNTAGTYHVVASTDTSPPVTASAPVTVPIQVQVTPPTDTCTVGDVVDYAANVLGSANQAVTWTIQEGAAGGSISSAGVYKPPAVAGTYHIVATSAVDTTRPGVVPVTVQTSNGTVTIQ
ncbi:MAG TPA: hypothetical protein VKU60_07495 [Chloroflexota bacterium]|nr:hypothetical protein [Chloroflexota bacterium]